MKAEDVIYNALMANETIVKEAKGRIKFYEYPETGDVTGAYIVIDPLDSPLAADYADNTWLTWDYLFQLDVWTKDRQLTNTLMKEVNKTLWDIGFHQSGGTGDEWDKDTGIFRQAKRFRGKIYRKQLI